MSGNTWAELTTNLPATAPSTQAPVSPAAKRTSRQGMDLERVKYPHPSLDMTSTYLPQNMKEMLVYVAGVALTDPLISQCISKMSEYPITDLMYGSGDNSEFTEDELKEKWKLILEEGIDIRSAMKQCGMDYHAYGISIVSVNYPFRRLLKCPKCDDVHTQDNKHVKFKNWKFESKCECGHAGNDFIVKDILDRSFKKISLNHWDLMLMDIKFNSVSGHHFFYYSIPGHVKNALESGDMDFVKTSRMEVIEAAKSGKKVKLAEDNLFFMKRQAPQYIYPSERGWGVSAIFSVMKEVFHNRILKKGNEMIAFDHIVPMRVISPQPMGEMSPHLTMDASLYRTAIDREIENWRVDPNHIMYAPMPITVTHVGGDARALMVTPEIKMVEDDIIIGMGIIPEIIKGGASWSGSSVSLRIVENSFINHRGSLLKLMKFVVKNISATYDIPEIDIKMVSFKMADDATQKQLMFQASTGTPSNKAVSTDTFLKEMGLDPEKEYELKQKELSRSLEMFVTEQVGNARGTGEAAIINAIFQADAQAENNNRLQMRERQAIGEQQKAEQAQKDEQSQVIYEEIGALANGLGINPENLNMSNILTVITERLIALQKSNIDTFSQVMLRIKNSYPNVYQIVYNNIREVNVIKADTAPDLNTAQRFTPGEIPVYNQGGTTADSGADPIEQGGPAPAAVKQAPEQKPPRSTSPDM